MQVVEAGAETIHFHIRNAAGAETLSNPWASEQIRSIREKLPHIPIGVSTGEWIEPSLTRRVNSIKDWTEFPDFASLNFSELGYEIVAQALLDKGVQLEAGLSDVSDAERFIQSGLAGHCRRILLEPQQQDLKDALRNVEQMLNILSIDHAQQEILLHGRDKTTWKLFEEALLRGFSTRIGLEDTLYLLTGEPAQSNYSILLCATALRKSIGQ